MSSSKKKPTERRVNALEQKIHKAALAAGRPLSSKELEAIAPDPGSRVSALNHLSSIGLIKAQTSGDGLLWRAVSKDEFNIKQNLNDEENMVLSFIQASSTQGIWTKHIKSKTELHQTVVDRCLKSLTSKMLVKVVKSVKYPTRKIYMLAGLDPSIELTGGPWYTDNELDVEFIQALTQSCLSFIRGRTFPKQRPDLPDSAQPLFAPNAAPRYPDASTINAWIAKNNITPTELSDEHVEAILSVLVLDGDIERLPASGGAVFDLNPEQSDSDSEDEQKSKKRKKSSSSSKSRKRRRTESDSEDESSASSSEDERRKRKKSKAKKRKRDESDDESSADPDESPDDKRKRRKKRRKEQSRSDSESDSESDDTSRRHKRSKSRSKSRKSHSSDESEDGGKKKSRRGSSKRESPEYDPFGPVGGGGGNVYRAIRPEQVALGWAEAPCGSCSVFEFCTSASKGPVNPRDCEYYGKWLEGAVTALNA